MSWISLNVSVVGTSHQTRGVPCQDSTSVVITGADNQVAILALSDGAGSAKFSDEAAHLMVHSWIEEFEAKFSTCSNADEIISDYKKQFCVSVLKPIREKLIGMAAERECSLDEFSGTFLGAVLAENYGFVIQIGDGAWILNQDGILGLPTLPQEGEYVGQTTFLTSAKWEEQLQFTNLCQRPKWLVGLSDGTQHLALDSTTLAPSPRFFMPLVEGVRTLGENAEKAIRDFLSSERVCERTDDDKSLIFLIDESI